MTRFAVARGSAIIGCTHDCAPHQQAEPSGTSSALRLCLPHSACSTALSCHDSTIILGFSTSYRQPGQSKRYLPRHAPWASVTMQAHAGPCSTGGPVELFSLARCVRCICFGMHSMLQRTHAPCRHAGRSCCWFHVASHGLGQTYSA